MVDEKACSRKIANISSKPERNRKKRSSQQRKLHFGSKKYRTKVITAKSQAELSLQRLLK